MPLERCPPIKGKNAACSRCGTKVPGQLGASSWVNCTVCRAMTPVRVNPDQDYSKQAVEPPQRPRRPAVVVRRSESVRPLPRKRTTLCSRCGLCLSVPHDAILTRCVLCDNMMRVQRPTSGLEDSLKGLICNLMSQPETPTPEEECQLPASYPCAPGMKRALLVGIGYTGTKYERKGTLDDVNKMSALLRDRFNFPSGSILVLTEEEKDPDRVPTMKNLLLAMRWLVQGCNTDDALSLVFHFSGHAYNKRLWAVDFRNGGTIPDKQIKQTMVRPLGPGVKLHAFMNLSSTDHTVLLDLRYLYSVSITRARRIWWWDDQEGDQTPTTGTNGGLAISISGGAITYNLIKTLESPPPKGTTYTYEHLIQAIRAGPGQGSQLRASEAFNISSKPFLL